MSLLLKENGPSLASVVGSPPTEWEPFKVSSKSLPAQLHVMFWGKSMADEERDWRDAQPPMPVEGTGLGIAERQGGDEQMDVDVSKVEDSDDDIIEGCYPLEIDIDGFEYPRIWIRAEYIRIYDALQDRYRKPSYPYLAPAVIITGQPGIGKSIWIFYALRRRLAERKPVIWYFRKARYLFVEEGVYKVPEEFHDFEIFVWTLVDSDEEDRVPENLVMRHTRHFVIYCTSPSRDRWSRLHKTVHDDIFIMNPWKSKEILRLISMLPPGTKLYENVDSVFNELGPTPRLCIDYSRSHDRIKQYRQDLQVAITALTIDELQRVLQASRSLAMNEVSHKICLISRQDRENMYSSAVVSPITSLIKSRLASHFRKLERGKQIRLYKYFSKVPGSRATAGIFFEAAAQGCLQDGVTLSLLPMVRLPSGRGKNKPQWYSSHISLPNATLEAARQEALKKLQPLNIPQHLPIVEYTDDGPSSIESNVLYLPELTNQVALNSFILTNDLLYIFQFSVSSVHDIKPGLIDFIRKCPGPPSMDKCCFVFIHPPNHTLICPQPRKLEMRELHPCSAALDLDAINLQRRKA